MESGGSSLTIAARHEPFRVRFERVGLWPGVVYLAPEPADRFSRLIDDLVAAFPHHPPYGGAFDEVIPHLTITEAAAMRHSTRSRLRQPARSRSSGR